MESNTNTNSVRQDTWREQLWGSGNDALRQAQEENPAKLNDAQKRLLEEQNVVFEKSSKHLSELFRKRTGLVSFTGTGVSIAGGITDWQNLLQKMSDTLAATTRTLAELKSPDLPLIADEIYKEYEAAGKTDEFFKAITDSVTNKHHSTTTTLIKMAMIIKKHVTTNYDSSIEKAYQFLELMQKHFPNKSNFEYESVMLGDSMIRSFYGAGERKNVVVHLHGDVERRTYLLRKSSYEQYYPTDNSKEQSSEITSFLKEVYFSETLVFIGFSFEDYYVKNYLFSLRRKRMEEISLRDTMAAAPENNNKPDNVNHYWITSYDPDKFGTYPNARIKEFENAGINVILYNKGQHIFLESLFEEMLNSNLVKDEQQIQF